MLIKVRIYNNSGTSQSETIEISKKALVKELKDEINKKVKILVDHQMIIFLGKQLENHGSLIDYKMDNGATISLYVRENGEKAPQNDVGNKDEVDEEKEEVVDEDLIETTCKFYKINDFVDVMLEDTGAWYEAVIVKILMNKNVDENDKKQEDIIYRVESAEHLVPNFEVDVKFQEIRPRSYYVYKTEELSPGLVVLANYNLEAKKSRGLWYTYKINTITRKTVTGTVLVGCDQTPIEECTIIFTTEIMRIEEPALFEAFEQKEEPRHVKRVYPYHCNTCLDNRNKKCKDCGCKKCNGKENFDKILLCDECDGEYHMYCLDPPLEKVPSGEWFCPDCKLDVKIVNKGEILIPKKLANMPNKKTTSNRDWGRGMACAGRSKVCTIVEKNFFGPIPGIEVGTRWLYRIQVSEAGVHRPTVSGIHGVAEHGAYSVVLSGGYEDDIDKGFEFLYTGSGGRDLTGNKRVSVQSCDQKLTSCNLALAKNCNAPFNEKGAEAIDWRGGKPIRVVRNYKGRAHSQYAPEEGNRYDGIYKVVKYFPEKGLAGFIVWKYLLRRDDPAPAPWEKGGHELDIIYPPLYLENLEKKKEEKGNSQKSSGPGKRKNKENTLTDFLNTPKKLKFGYKLPTKIADLIKKDEPNIKYWAECDKYLSDGKSEYSAKVEEKFNCLYCQYLVYLPVTLACTHSFCKACLKNAMKNDIDKCPACRYQIPKDFKMEENENFSSVLKFLFPGYGNR